MNLTSFTLEIGGHTFLATYVAEPSRIRVQTAFGETEGCLTCGDRPEHLARQMARQIIEQHFDCPSRKTEIDLLSIAFAGPL